MLKKKKKKKQNWKGNWKLSNGTQRFKAIQKINLIRFYTLNVGLLNLTVKFCFVIDKFILYFLGFPLV